MTADEILAIPIDRPERLFKSTTTIDKEFRALAREWHPDTNSAPEATAVSAHLSALRAQAHQKTKDGTWQEDSVITLKTKDGRSFRVRYGRERHTETGKVFYGKTTMLWLIDPAFADLAAGVADTIGKFQFASKRMDDEMRKYLPTIVDVHDCQDGSIALVMRKTDDVFLLDDILQHFGGKLDPKHVAWILSGLYNVACYLEFSRLCHGGIALDSVFVSPKFHSVMLFGGWCYATPIGQKLKALSRLVHSVTPPDVLREKTAASIIDTTSIRMVGRALLGDRTGMMLRGVAPDTMVTFLRAPATSSARQDYANWQKAIGESFGVRRFVELKVSESDIFHKEQ